jgi:hypothetical protein
MLKPAQLSMVMTHLGGREDKRFPLTMLTEGVGNTKGIDQLEYEYDVKTPPINTRPIAETPASTVNVGRGGVQFFLTFGDKWFIKDYVLISQSGAQVRIMGEPVPNGANWNYPVRIVTPDATATVPAADLQAGSLWGQMFAPVGTDFSRGNASNWTAPTKVKGKLTTIRKSYQMSGNAKDTVVELELPTKSGSSKYWMDHEEWQYWLQWKEEMESLYWYAEQSYDENGVTHLRDENGQPIVIGPGIFQQIVNKDYYSELTAKKIRDVIRDLFSQMTDAQNKEITLYTGIGGAEEFDQAMKAELTGYRAFNDGKFVTGSGRNMTLTGFFTRYEHPDGHTVKVVKVPMFDHGTYAQTRQRHPRTGLSLESHRMVFLDTSNYDGQANIVMIQKNKRELLRWAVAGSTVPNGFTGNDTRASDIDGCAVHYLKVGGILLRRFDTSIDLQCAG